MRTEIFIVDGYAIELGKATLENMHQHDADEFYEQSWLRPFMAEASKHLVSVALSDEEYAMRVVSRNSLFADQDLIGNAIDFNSY